MADAAPEIRIERKRLAEAVGAPVAPRQELLA